MKFDEKTGKGIPESRSDEIKLAIERMNEVRKATSGLNDKGVEISNLLCDINISLGLIVDILSVMYNEKKQSEKGVKDNDERTAEDQESVD